MKNLFPRFSEACRQGEGVRGQREMRALLGFLVTIGGSGWRGAVFFKDQLFVMEKTYRSVSRKI